MLVAVITCASLPLIFVNSSEVIFIIPESIGTWRESLISSIFSSKVFPSASSTKIEIAGLNLLVAGPTADTSGALGCVFSGSWTNQPVGKVIENPNFSLEYSSLVIGSGDNVIRSGSVNSKRSETSERLTTSAFLISAAVKLPGIVAPCSVFAISGWIFAGVSIFAILSSVSKLSWVTILPNTVYWPSRKFESSWTIKNCEPALFGSTDLAIETSPLLCFMSLNSASIE